MSLQFILSQRNRQKLADGGFLFIKDKEDSEKTFWKCDYFKKLHCKARLHTANDQIVKRIGEHSHAGEAAKIEAVKVVNKVKELAQTSQEDTDQILSGALFGLSQAVSGQMPSYETLKKTIRNTKRRANQLELTLPNPAAVVDLSIPLDYQTTHAGVEFLLFDSDNGPDRILIFSTSNNLQLLAQSQRWYAEGTFKTCPPLFGQLYTIHGVVNNSIIPVVYALLPRKDEETYIRFLDALTNLQHNLSPTLIIADFEIAAINAFHSKFPDTQQKGCFFHFCQCVYQNIQANSLQHRYDIDTEFALKMRMIPALAFLPIPYVVNGFEQLSDDNFPTEAQPVLDYVEDMFIGRPDRKFRRRSPPYNHSFWNCYDAALEGLSKINNSCESWHCSFSHSISTSQPTIWKFITAIKNEQSLNEEKIDRCIAGEAVPPGKKRYRDTAAKIERFVKDFENQDILNYLKALAHNFNF